MYRGFTNLYVYTSTPYSKYPCYSGRSRAPSSPSVTDTDIIHPSCCLTNAHSIYADERYNFHVPFHSCTTHVIVTSFVTSFVDVSGVQLPGLREGSDDAWGRATGSGLHATGRILLNVWRWGLEQTCIERPRSFMLNHYCCFGEIVQGFIMWIANCNNASWSRFEDRPNQVWSICPTTVCRLGLACATCVMI